MTCAFLLINFMATYLKQKIPFGTATDFYSVGGSGSGIGSGSLQGWNVMDIKIWNPVALCKLRRALSRPKDRLWIRWVYCHYVKG